MVQTDKKEKTFMEKYSHILMLAVIIIIVCYIGYILMERPGQVRALNLDILSGGTIDNTFLDEFATRIESAQRFA
jgi:lipoprotein signal peptidase